jgi:hypothetical protein
MATSSDPRAAGFNAAEFRDAIKFAMHMGLPEDTNERATFQWTPQKTYSKTDAAGRPLSWTAAPLTTNEHEDVQIDVAVEFQRYTSGEGITSIGEFHATSAVLTVLDDDYAEVEGADKVLLGGNTYTIEYVAPPDGMFGVTVYQIYLRAEDES